MQPFDSCLGAARILELKMFNSRILRESFCFLGLEMQSQGIDAVTQSSGLWSIWKYMPQMAVTDCAEHFSTDHEP